MPHRTTSKPMSRPNLLKRLERIQRELAECQPTIDTGRFCNLRDRNDYNFLGCWGNTLGFLSYTIRILREGNTPP